MSKRIEIAGLPGVGKTTLIEKYAARLRGDFCVIESRKPNLFNRIVAKIFLHGWMRCVLKDRKLAAGMAYRLSFRPFTGYGKPALFYDSGIIQYFLEAVISGTSEIDGMLKVFKCAAPDTLIYITDDLRAIVAREMGRDQRRFPDMSAEMLADCYKNAEGILKSRVFPLIRQVHIVNIHDENDFLEKVKT